MRAGANTHPVLTTGFHTKEPTTPLPLGLASSSREGGAVAFLVYYLTAMSREVAIAVILVVFVLLMLYDTHAGPDRCPVCRGFTHEKRCPVGEMLSRKDDT